jgi:dipeptidyl aminopeptidase/acylaminoacyl peptidase
MIRKTLFFIVAIFLVLPLCLNGEHKDVLSIDLFLEWESVLLPKISPDGKQIVYSRRKTDKVNDGFISEIWIMNIDGSKKRFLVKGYSPQWSPDGKRLAYLAKGEPMGTQIFVRWMDTEQATQLTRVEASPSRIQWSPDGKKIAFNMYGPAEKTWRVKMPDRPKGAKWATPPLVIDRLNYRADGRGYRSGGFRHIYTVPATGGTPRRLTSGDYNDGPPRWTPDGQAIVFSGLRVPDWDWLYQESEIYILSLKDGKITPLTNRKGPDRNPEISPNGKMIAYTGFDKTDDTYHVPQLYVMDVNGKNKRSLMPNLDRRPLSIQWAGNNRDIFFIMQDRGTFNLYSVSLNGKIRQITRGNHTIFFPSFYKDVIAAAELSSIHEPGDIVTFSLKRGWHPQPNKIKRLTAVNDDLLENRKLGDVEEIWYDSVGGMKIQGWIVKPPDFDPKRKYPLILYIHGGPHSMYGVRFNFEFQNHAANGFVVLYTNPRGSSGYGKKFGNAIKNNYPGQDYDDLMKGVDQVIKKGYIDEKNLFVCGGSGGGVLTSWIVGHTDRFAAAVVMKPVTDWFSFVGTTDNHHWYYNFKQFPWEDPAEHLRRSPLMYVGNVTTPTLLLTGEKDLRTPLEQTEQYYRALKLRKVETAMIRISDEFHGIGHRHPTNKIWQILYLRGWFEKFMHKKGDM